MDFLDKSLPELLITVISLSGFIGLALVLTYLSKKKRCTKCRSFLNTRQISKDNLGKDFGNSSYETYRVVYKCSKCGNIWTVLVTEEYGSY